MEEKQQNACIQGYWFSKNPGKRWCEEFFLYYSLVWISYFGCIVISRAYETFEEWEYLIVGLSLALPCILIPLIFFPGQGEPHIPIIQRYIVKANLWISIFSFVGNYFWTHYFYNLLGAQYTFPSHRINNVPISMFLCTHAYFCTYHTCTTILLRRFWSSSIYRSCSSFKFIQLLASWVFIFTMAYFTAFMETWSISSFPYWTFQNRSLMYSIGSICYGLYFIVSFPMFYRLDEHSFWTIEGTAMNALASCMMVTLLLDFWRLIVGGIVPNVPNCVPFL